MKNRVPIIVGLRVASLIAFSLAPLRAAALDHSGICTGTFAALQNPHVLTGFCQVPAGQTLTIQPGVVLEGQGNTLQIVGSLNAAGTALNKIHSTDMYWDFQP